MTEHDADGIDWLAYKFWAIHPSAIDAWATTAPPVPPGYPGGVRAWYYACEIRRQLGVLPGKDKPLTAAALADAFDCFNNDALTLMHGGTHDIGCIAAGFAAIAARLRET